LTQIKAAFVFGRILAVTRRTAMPLESIVVSCLVTAMFALFVLTLAYGEYQTRHFKRPSEGAETAREQAQDRWPEAA
jgi:hypothetical protein